jgi:hypothetical protein
MVLFRILLPPGFLDVIVPTEVSFCVRIANFAMVQLWRTGITLRAIIQIQAPFSQQPFPHGNDMINFSGGKMGKAI